VLDVMRFWLERGVDGFRLDTVNYYFHDPQLRSNPAPSPPGAPALRGQSLRHAGAPLLKSQPENVAFLKRIAQAARRVPGHHDGRRGRRQPQGVELMAEYTSGGDKLHMCLFLRVPGQDYSRRTFPQRHRGSSSPPRPEGWPCWSFSNHDVVRHVSRWAKSTRRSPGSFGRQAARCCFRFAGSVCLYQGEELGLPEADICSRS
jgi:alpha-glucosidase